MYLRELKEKDAFGMLEWMHDADISCNFRQNFKAMDEAKCIEFIKRSKEDNNNKHFAVCDDKDEYLGTVSLKNIDRKNKNAEYAIVMRSKAIGKGAALEATCQILEYAFETMQLHKVYLNVLTENIRANKFYKKAGFTLEGNFKECLYLQEEFKDLNWYGILKENFHLLYDKGD